MNSVPMSVILSALEALKLAHARLNDPATPDPYMAVIRAESSLEYYIGKFEAVEVKR